MSGVASSAVRRPSHADSWYDGNAARLSVQLQGWLDAATTAAGAGSAASTTSAEAVPPSKASAVGTASAPELLCSVGTKLKPRAIIAPHAGYSYSGPTAAFAYQYLKPSGIKRVFVLGPSHHFYLENAALPSCTEYQTPFGRIPIDKAVVATLHATGQFDVVGKEEDEDEHSLEMHLPYIHHILRESRFTLVPIMVGATSARSEAALGKILAPYFVDPENFFVVSSDFAHWGSRFSFQYVDKSQPTLWEGIQALDKKGIQLVESGDVTAFRQYLNSTKNTICGRHPISVLMETIAASGDTTMKTQFVAYAQSSRCLKMTDSSVSYAAAVIGQPNTAATTSSGETHK